MSDDLISRKALLKELREIMDEPHNTMFLMGIGAAVSIVEHRETAFDKEKVINEIHISAAGMVVNMNVSSSYAEGYIDAAKDIIEIVEKGGIE